MSAARKPLRVCISSFDEIEKMRRFMVVTVRYGTVAGRVLVNQKVANANSVRGAKLKCRIPNTTVRRHAVSRAAPRLRASQ